MGQGGGTDLGLALSGSSSATSGLTQTFSRLFGDNISGAGLPKWAFPALILGGALLAIVYILRKW